MLLLFICSICIGYVFHKEANERGLKPWKWSLVAVAIYFFSFLTFSTPAKALLRFLEFSPGGLAGLLMGLTVSVMSLIPLAFLSNAIKRRGGEKKLSS